jgi:hypothetical protein
VIVSVDFCVNCLLTNHVKIACCAQDFNNEEHFQDIRIEPPNSDFMMLPPMIDAAESGSNSAIQFEPLPDISVLRRQRMSATSSNAVATVTANTNTNTSNLAQLRPKVAQIGHDRFDSDDEIEYLSGDSATFHERVKLEKLLCELTAVLCCALAI